MIFLIFQNFAFLQLYGHFFRHEMVFLDTESAMAPMFAALNVWANSKTRVQAFQCRQMPLTETT